VENDGRVTSRPGSLLPWIHYVTGAFPRIYTCVSSTYEFNAQRRRSILIVPALITTKYQTLSSFSMGILELRKRPRIEDIATEVILVWTDTRLFKRTKRPSSFGVPIVANRSSYY
jgi:hypothetical protein